uniref:F-box domain-containing protein n=1 Tax=Aegilops tauschii subsp. strangulata TaxID=200361 RepID=A0A453GF73_AEGTS
DFYASGATAGDALRLLRGAALVSPSMSTRGEMSPRRRSTSPPPPASLPDDMLGEILLRLPPRPSSLPRASLVSKRWYSLVADPQFQRRFRDHHGKPPLLGFFLQESPSSAFVPILDRPDRIPRGRFSMPLSEGTHIVDCRHGLVLSLSRSPPHRLLVWDPVAREQRRLVFPPELDNDQMLRFNGAVLRPARSQGSHFQVALIAHYKVGNPCTRVFACLYSSETGIWSKINSLQLQSSISLLGPGPSTLIGNSLCWLLWEPSDNYVILEFDLDTQSLTETELPPQVEAPLLKLRIVPTEDGGLGFIHLSGLHGQLWKREPGSVWVLDRAIEFEELRSVCKGDRYPRVVGFSEDSNAILLQTNSGVFMVYLRSMEFKKISNMGVIRLRCPFACFYPAGNSQPLYISVRSIIR